MHFGNIVCFVNQLLFPVYEKTNNAAIFSFYLNCKTATAETLYTFNETEYVCV
jgi:hypothetical protein